MGISTIIGNIILFILFIGALIQFYRQHRFNVQIIILFVATIFVFPMIFFENILYLDLHYHLFGLHYNRILVILLFIFGLVGFFTYHLFLLSIEDFPSGPLGFIGIASGFAVGTMVTSVQIDPTNTLSPIYYDPLFGGALFILMLIFFNIIGGAGFLRSLFLKKWAENYAKMSLFDGLGLFNFIINPMVIFVLRIWRINFLPFNFVFFPTVLGFGFHLLGYIIHPTNSGFPNNTRILSLVIVDQNQKTVIAGYNSKGDADTTKVQGMRVLAITDLIDQMLGESESHMQQYIDNYGNILFVKQNGYVLIAALSGFGRTAGKFVLSQLLRTYRKRLHNNQDIDFESLVNYYIHYFVHKKSELTDSTVYNLI